MRKLALLALLVPGLAFSQVSLSAGIRIDLPVVLPQLVVITPGVQVVPDVGYEVFYVDGFYWTRMDDGHWYRSRSHRGGWVVAPVRVVPAYIRQIPPGHYKRWKPAKGHWKKDDRRGGKPHRHEARRDDGRGERDKRGEYDKRGHDDNWRDRDHDRGGKR
ncbi:MAG TPA: hypothetical protein VD838_17985 [Anaeromyxobacteraceae bacterium]|nr:hypothetical protein [Anaeromyxobacteraceae bacterium]